MTRVTRDRCLWSEFCRDNPAPGWLHQWSATAANGRRATRELNKHFQRHAVQHAAEVAMRKLVWCATRQ